MTGPTVSILIPCYNAAPYLEQSIRSALAQCTTVSAEILLWDDGSTDDSVEIARRFVPQIQVMGDGINRGGNIARNRLLSSARGDWLQYLDADDLLLPKKIASQLAVGNETGADVIYSKPRTVSDAEIDELLVTAPGEPARPIQPANAAPGVEQDSLQLRDPWVDFIRWGIFQTSSMLMRRAAVLAVGGWKDDQPRCQEHELLLRILIAGGRLVHMADSRTLYRIVHGTSVSRRNVSDTTRMRMQLTDRAEAFLLQHGELTGAQRAALAAARMESARSLYRQDAQAANRLAARVGRLGTWQAAGSDALPRSYRLLTAMFGFLFAENLAARLRRSSL